ncbi:hypothetical protein [Nocardia abscessus]|uniref:hypothetical protein n=1 Tax=Nocardia abscessus TaxID=120957 RepID=UPI0024572824|nr:hypothetical protein [Nocardia abscessus]
MSDGYDNDREKYKPHERGRIFENGTYLYFRDRENGYFQQSRIFKTIEGGIRFDKIKEDQGQTLSIEDKSGRIDGDKDLNQLRVLRALLEKKRKSSPSLTLRRGGIQVTGSTPNAGDPACAGRA